MPISPKARALIGVMTTLLFLVLGVSFLLSERTGFGLLLVVLGLLRGSYAVRQWSAAFARDDD